jgi:hypothetical protein
MSKPSRLKSLWCSLVGHRFASFDAHGALKVLMSGERFCPRCATVLTAPYVNDFVPWWFCVRSWFTPRRLRVGQLFVATDSARYFSRFDSCSGDHAYVMEITEAIGDIYSYRGYLLIMKRPSGELPTFEWMDLGVKTNRILYHMWVELKMQYLYEWPTYEGYELEAALGFIRMHAERRILKLDVRIEP